MEIFTGSVVSVDKPERIAVYRSADHEGGARAAAAASTSTINVALPLNLEAMPSA